MSQCSLHSLTARTDLHTWKRYKGTLSRTNKKVLPKKRSQFFLGMCHMLDSIIYYAIPQSTRTKEKLKILKPTFKSPDISVSKDVPLDIRKPVCLENVWTMFFPLYLKIILKNEHFCIFECLCTFKSSLLLQTPLLLYNPTSDTEKGLDYLNSSHF